MRITAIAVALAALSAMQAPPSAQPITWRLNNLSLFASDRVVEIIGAPVVVPTDLGPAIRFNGASDGLLIGRNPIAGLKQFTIDVLLSPDVDGQVEQRFVHMQDAAADNRALVELRLNDGRWALDSYLRHGEQQRTLLEPAKTHTAGAWHVATTTYDGSVMRNYVDGVEQGSGPLAFGPIGAGQTSIGVRQNRVSWFKGMVHTLRVTPSVLPQSQFLVVPARVIP